MDDLAILILWMLFFDEPVFYKLNLGTQITSASMQIYDLKEVFVIFKKLFRDGDKDGWKPLKRQHESK